MLGEIELMYVWKAQMAWLKNVRRCVREASSQLKNQIEKWSNSWIVNEN